MNIMAFERNYFGVLGFYFSGIPIWAVSTCLSICRHHPLERLISFLQSRLLSPSSDGLYSMVVRSGLSIFHYAYVVCTCFAKTLVANLFCRARGGLLAVAVQTYMYSLLQSLHIVDPYAIPGSQLFIPFGELAAAQLPPLPTDASIGSLGTFILGLAKTPAVLVYLYVYLRPVIEIRLYRLIRRRLPKPSLADELSIRVAFENDLIDWMVPTLGRRSEEENRRNRFTLVEDIMDELAIIREVFHNWTSSWFGFRPKQVPDRAPNPGPREQRIESLRQSIEELQSELGAVRSRRNLLEQQSTETPRTPREHSTRGRREGAPPRSPRPAISLQTPELGSVLDGDRFLSNEENRISQSPDRMSGDLSEMEPLGRSRSVPSPIANPSRRTAAMQETRDDDTAGRRRNSRSNTLFSRPSSPETSPPHHPAFEPH